MTITSSSSNNSTTFEQFTASCEDAWNDKIEDKISYPTSLEKNNLNNHHHLNLNHHHQTYLIGGVSSNKHKFGNNKSSIVIKEKSNDTAAQGNSVNNNINNNNNQESNNNSNSSSRKIEISSGGKNLNPRTTTTANNYDENNGQNVEEEKSYCDPKLAKLKKLLYEDEITDLNQLRTISWGGITDQDRPTAWKLLLGYLPTVRSKRAMVLENKKLEYQNLVAQYYYNRQENDEMYRQIHIDIPRMQPLITIFQQPIVQGIFERILYIWSIRHPASGYVQGMNDLVTPFFVTYLSEYVPGYKFSNVEKFDVSTLPDDILATIEADSYWSFNKLLDSIQDNYTFAQPGIQRLVQLLSKVVSRVDQKLHEHLENNSVEYLQFAFRWMNNLLIREIPLRCIIRLWDTYLSEGAITSNYVPSTNFNDSLEINSWSMNSGTPFSSAFHLFVCAAFLRFWSKSLLQEKDFQGLMLRLQNLPTFHWSEKEVRLLVADAYQLKYAFSPNHLKV